MYTRALIRSSVGPAITAPAYACPTSTTGPLVLSRALETAVMSSLSDVRGIGAQITSRPCRCKGRMTFCQHEPSAHAPCTKIIVPFSALILRPHLFAPGLYSVRCKKLSHRRSNLHHVRLQSKMPCVEHLHLCAGNVLAKRFRPSGNEERIVLAPNREQRRFRLAKIFLKCRVELDVGRVVQKQIELNVFVSRPLHERHIERVGF